MEVLYVGVGNLAVSQDPGCVLKAVALGSCVALILLCPAAGSAGLLHVALPDSAVDRKRAAENPGAFADTGVPALLEAMRGLGCEGNGGLVAKLAGGASIMDPGGAFNIGGRNLAAVRELLGSHGLETSAEDVGGTISRSVSVRPGTDCITVTSPRRGSWTL